MERAHEKREAVAGVGGSVSQSPALDPPHTSGPQSELRRARSSCRSAVPAYRRLYSTLRDQKLFMCSRLIYLPRASWGWPELRAIGTAWATDCSRPPGGYLCMDPGFQKETDTCRRLDWKISRSTTTVDRKLSYGIWLAIVHLFDRQSDTLESIIVRYRCDNLS